MGEEHVKRTAGAAEVEEVVDEPMSRALGAAEAEEVAEELMQRGLCEVEAEDVVGERMKFAFCDGSVGLWLCAVEVGCCLPWPSKKDSRREREKIAF